MKVIVSVAFCLPLVACSQVQSSSDEAVDKSTQEAMTPEEGEATQEKVDKTQQGTSSQGTEDSHGPVSELDDQVGLVGEMPATSNGEVLDPTDTPSPELPYPGDLRGGLRTPQLPDVLPLTLDGKINQSSPTPQNQSADQVSGS